MRASKREGRVKRKRRFGVCRRLLMPPVTAKKRATAQSGCKKGHYKPLPKEFRWDGFTYRQIAREGNAAIYEQRWAGCAAPSVSYEVIRVRRREGFEIGGRFVEPGRGLSKFGS